MRSSKAEDDWHNEIREAYSAEQVLVHERPSREVAWHNSNDS